MYKPESDQENDKYKIVKAFRIQMDHSILVKIQKIVLFIKYRTFYKEDVSFKWILE